MAEIFKFFNSAPGDERWHYASDFADYFGSVLSSGLLHENGSYGLQVTVNSGTLITNVAVGKALIKGYSYENTNDLTLTHSLPEQTLDRIDRIVLRLDLRNANRFIKVFVKEGVSATNPVASDLQRDNYVYELSLATVRLRANTSSISANDITDTRASENECGIVQSLITVPTSVFQQQFDEWFFNKKETFSTELSNWQTQEDQDFELWRTAQKGMFDEWFLSVQNILDGNVAANLANRIASHETDLSHVHWVGDAQGTNDLVLTSDKTLYYQNGLGVSFKVLNTSNDVTTLNINNQGNIPVLESDGEPFKSFKANGVYTVRYSSGNFILQGSSGISRAAQITNLQARGGNPGGGKIVLTWSNPTDGKAKGIRIMYKEGSYPLDENDGLVFYDSNDAEIPATATKTGLIDGKTYYIRAFIYTYQNATKLYTKDTDGAQVMSTVFNSQGTQTFTTSGTFTVPFGINEVEVFAVGGGGAGFYPRSSSLTGGSERGGGGGGGGYTATQKINVTALQNIAVAVGAGGAMAASAGSFGGNGGTSRFGSYLTANGGAGDNNTSAGANGGSGGGGGSTMNNKSGGGGGTDGSDGFGGDNITGSALNSVGESGKGQGETTRAFGRTDGSLYAGGGGGAGGAGGGGAGGGGSLRPATNATANTGGGGGGNSNGGTAGAGGSGIVIVRWGY